MAVELWYGVKPGNPGEHHAEIVRFEDRYLVRDLNSTNGTFVCFAGEPHLEWRLEGQNALKNGSIVRFGQASYTLLIND